MLTFPPDKSDFRAPNGVTYAWDGTDGKWRVKAFRSIDDFIVNLQDNPPLADESKVGDLWFDTSDESLTLFVYTGDEWIPAAPPVSLDGINATIDAALIVQNDLLARVESGEIVQTGVLSDLTTLQNRVETLEGTIIDGNWALDNRSVAREGYFLGLAGAVAVQDWTLVTRLQMHPVDSTGKSFTFVEVNVDDVVRIGGVGGSAAFKMTSTFTQSGDVYEADVQLLSHSGSMVETLSYGFEFLPGFDPSTYATIEYVNGQDDLDVKLAAVNDVSTNFRIKSGGNTLISTATEGELGLYHVKDPSDGNAEWAATKGYVDGNFIKTAGQTDLDSQVFKIRQPNLDGNFRSFINIHNGEMNLYNVADPSGSGHEKWAANREYVDSKVATAVDGLATEEYVDTEVAKVAGQTQTFWYPASHQTAENLQPGEFFISDINEHLYLHTTSANGVDLGVGSSERVFNVVTLFSVHATNGNSMYCAKSDRINFGSGSNNYMRVAQDTVFFRQQLNQGTKYVLNIPGFTP